MPHKATQRTWTMDDTTDLITTSRPKTVPRQKVSTGNVSIDGAAVKHVALPRCFRIVWISFHLYFISFNFYFFRTKVEQSEIGSFKGDSIKSKRIHVFIKVEAFSWSMLFLTIQIQAI